jgi:protein-disulfide isomerase
MKLKNAVGEQDHKQGDESAFLTLVEYGDYQCPHCGAAYPVIKKLQAHFKGNLLFVFRNFPLAEIHPFAMSAALVAEAAGLQKKFWPVHDLIFENQEILSTQQLIKWAEEAGADINKLEKDMRSETVRTKVENDFEGGVRSGVNGTPGFFINEQRYDGDYSFEHMKNALDKILQMKSAGRAEK